MAVCIVKIYPLADLLYIGTVKMQIEKRANILHLTKPFPKRLIEWNKLIEMSISESRSVDTGGIH